jgi:hypothetical protein
VVNKKEGVALDNAEKCYKGTDEKESIKQIEELYKTSEFFHRNTCRIKTPTTLPRLSPLWAIVFKER